MPPTGQAGRRSRHGEGERELEGLVRSVVEECESVGLPGKEPRTRRRRRSAPRARRQVALSATDGTSTQSCSSPLPEPHSAPWLAGARVEAAKIRRQPQEEDLQLRQLPLRQQRTPSAMQHAWKICYCARYTSKKYGSD